MNPTTMPTRAASLIHRLTEAPIDTGAYPDYIHPSRREQLCTGQHPYGRHPAVAPAVGPDNTPEKLGSRRYQAMMGRLQQHVGQGGPQQLMQGVVQALQTATQRERPHKVALERLAVDTVFELPEFQAAKEAYEKGHFKIDAKLTTPDLRGMRPGQGFEPPDPDAPDTDETEFNPEVDYDTLDSEQQKRRMTNAMIHGAAVNADYAFQLVQPELDRLDRKLAPAYAKVMAGTQLGYWMFPDELVRAAGSEAAVGSEKLDQEGKVPVVRARGIIFPVLVHELVKGLTELVSYAGLPRGKAMKRAVMKGDTLDAETWDLLIGPEVWRNLTDAVGVEDRRLLMDVYDALVKLPPDKFHAMTRGLTAGGAEAKAVAQQLLKAVKEHRQVESQVDPLLAAP